MNADDWRAFGQDVIIWPQAKVAGLRHIALGNRVIIDDFVLLIAGDRTEIGDFVHIASFVSLVGSGVLEMGAFCGISAGCRVFTGNDDFSGASLTGPAVPAKYRKALRSFVRIGKHAVVGANSVVLPGVSIGEGAVVGANSLVKSDCPPWTICAGTPARPIKIRPKDRILELERQLIGEAYDSTGKYIPLENRT